MQKIIVLYDENYNDVDILSVPDRIASCINDYGQSYCRWLESAEVDPKLYTTVNGVKCIILETDGFVDWLNSTVLKDEENKAISLESHVSFVEGYPILEF